MIYRNCAGCHRPGEAGPFPLLTYDDVRRRAQLVQTVTQSRYMPPWLPEPGYGDFEGVRRVSGEEIAMIEEWVAGGAPEGNPADLPPLPEWTQGWQLGEPDLVIRMPEPSSCRPAERMSFATSRFRSPFPNPSTSKASSSGPATPRSCIMPGCCWTVPAVPGGATPRSRDPVSQAACSWTRSSIPAGHWIGWTPGKQPVLRPDDMAWELSPGTDLVLEMHMLPTGKPERIQSSLGLYFTAAKPSRTPLILRLGSKTIDISPGEEHYVIEDRYVLPVDVEVLNVYPHAHYLGQQMEGWAVLPDGTKHPLLRIERWDFDWQDEYRYVKPPVLPRGTVIEMRFTYDNSTGNAENPRNPPVRVTYGWKTAEEMGDLWFQVLPRDSNDWALLSRDFGRKERLAQIAGYEKQLEIHPEDYEKHNALGNLYLEANETGKAIPCFRRALAIKPDYPTRTTTWASRASLWARRMRRSATTAPRSVTGRITLPPTTTWRSRCSPAATCPPRCDISRKRLPRTRTTRKHTTTSASCWDRRAISTPRPASSGKPCGSPLSTPRPITTWLTPWGRWQA